MIIDDKVLMNYPPPPYLSVTNPNATTEAAQSALSNVNASGRPNLPSLPPHILIQILYALFPDQSTAVLTPVSPALSSYTLRPGDPKVLNNYESRLFDDTRAEKQRKVLSWLSTSLRLVSRHLYIACMHVLRSIYLPSYQSLIRPPYSSDPFPLSVPTSPGGTSPLPSYGSSSCTPLPLNGWSSASPIKSLQRETGVLDRYIALKVRQDVFADDTELHMEPEEAFRDLFDVAQPRARLEDLVRIYGVREGVITVPGVRDERERIRSHGSSVETISKDSSLISLPISPTISSPSTSTPQLQQGQIPSKSAPRSFFSFMKKSSTPSIPQRSPVRPPIQPLPFSVITASFSPRKVGLIYNRKRTVSEVQRALSAAERRSETLEMLAKALVTALRECLEDNP